LVHPTEKDQALIGTDAAAEGANEHLAERGSWRPWETRDDLLTPDALYKAFAGLRKDASARVDGVTYAGYGVEAWENIQKLHGRDIITAAS
jgi:hypothetical protein